MAYSIVTPSYAADFERCKLLARSVERLVEGMHFILVDPIDVETFAPLEAYGATIVDAREIMHFRPVPLTRLWLSERGGLIRGWISQQIRKMAFASMAPSDHILFVDSDVVFVRPFDPARLERESKTPLFTIDWFNAESLAWANQARSLFQKPTQDFSHGYVHPTFWRRSTVQDMIKDLERLHGTPWQTLMARQKTLSEYNLYGIFVEEVRGLEQCGHYIFNEPLMHPSWDYGRDLDKFFADLSPDNVAMMFHSKDRVPVSAYRERVERLWT